jgi:Acyl-CoA dehydrogenases
MLCSLDAEHSRFREEIRTFVSKHLPDDIRRRGERGDPWKRDDYVRWQQILHAHGFGAPAWPVEYGGKGWSPLKKFLFDTECALQNAPREIPFGVNMVAPVIMKYGTEEQKKYYLPRIQTLEHWWAQGYSEPSAGSDLASLRTSAVRDGDHYVINGQKVWTTLAHFATHIFCLVRTDPNAARPQAGISFVLIDMSTPGITVRPIHTIDDEHELNEVWFDNVRVPVGNRIGEENKGWTYAKYLLQHERADIARVGRARALLSRVKAASERYPGYDERPYSSNGSFRRRLERVEIKLNALEVMNIQLLSSRDVASTNPMYFSILKIVGSELHQEISELALQVLGASQIEDLRGLPQERESDFYAERPFQNPADKTFMPIYLNNLKTTIYGGSTEIQKNIIFKMLTS